jgi:hypothetical protein
MPVTIVMPGMDNLRETNRNDKVQPIRTPEGRPRIAAAALDRGEIAGIVQ